MKVIATKWARRITFGKAAITLGEWILVVPERANDERLLRHESIHVEQYRELWYVGFLILYVLVSVYCLLRFWHPYYDNAFEREAHLFDDDENYRQTRQSHAWRDYINGPRMGPRRRRA